MLVPFATQSYRHPSLPLSAQRCKNAYAEAQPQDAKTPVAVFGAPGMEEFAECGDGPIRNMIEMGGTLYAVSGDDLYSVADSGTETLVGTGIAGTGRVGIAHNGTQICIVNGAQGYIYTAAAGLSRITDADFNAAKTVEFFDGYFVFDWLNTNKFFISASLDGTSYGALDFASAEVSPDNVLAVSRRQDVMMIAGSQTIEMMGNDPTQSFPITRIDGGLVERGLIGAYAHVNEDNAFYFLGDDRVFYRLNGVIPQRVSTHAIEAEWRTYSTVSDVHCDSMAIDGHKFIYVTFPTERVTWCLDVATSLWHERESWDENNDPLGRWRMSCIVPCYGYNLVGDAYDGKIGRIDPTIYTEYGNIIHQELTAPPLHIDRRRIFISRFELDVENGIGLTSGQGSDPQIMLDSSDDGGKTWNGLQLWNSAGAIGAYSQRLRWLRQGSSFSRVYRIAKSDPVRFALLAAHADIR